MLEAQLARLESELADCVSEQKELKAENEELRTIATREIDLNRIVASERDHVEAELLHVLASLTQAREELARIHGSRTYRGSQRVVGMVRRFRPGADAG